jgi:amino acid transporter
MTESTTAGAPPRIGERLEPDAIGVAQDTVIGMANAAPTVSIGLTLAVLASAAAYGGGVVILVTAIPMIIIANSYRRLNLWNANCGASFEWVGRAINPYLGFMTGWLMVSGSIMGTLSAALVLGPDTLAVFGQNSTSSPWPDILIGTAVIVVMLAIAIVGIKITARTQVSIAVIEYVILVGISIAGLVFVLGHHHGTYPITKDWFSLTGIGGHGSIALGILAAVFMFTGWEGTVYVNEEVRHRRVNPGRAAILAVAVIAIILAVAQIGLQGAVSPALLQKNSSAGLVYVADAIGGSGWGKVMAFALALSVIGCTGTGIVIEARMIYGMASHRVLPSFLANVSTRFRTPVWASLVVGFLLTAILWAYLLASGSLLNVFEDVIAIVSLLYIAFYILTAFAAIAYYRRRVFSNAWDFIIVALLPLGACALLAWVMYKVLQTAPAGQIWSIVGILGVGFVLMLSARFIQRSSFFQIPRETDDELSGPRHAGAASAD